MNVFNKLLLKAALSPASLYRKLGVNTEQLKQIVSIKLLMDDRRPNTFQQTTRKRKKERSGATLGTMFLSILVGSFFLFAFAIGNDIVTQLTFFFSMFIFMLASTLISDFTSVLIDVRDNYIILPKPVNDKTVVVARLLHILIHICKIVLPMVLPGIIFMCIKHSIGGGFILLLLSLFVVLFTVFLINAIYIVVLRITTPQKFQNVISYFQIFFAIAIYASYQILPRMMGSLDKINFNFSAHPAVVLLPPYWFAVAWQTLFTFSGSVKDILLTAASFVLPVLSLVVVVKYFAPSFNKKLALISTSDSGPATASKQHAQPIKKSYSKRLAPLFTKSGAERTGFLFAWKMTARSKDFRVKVYPSVGYLLVYLFVMLYNFHSLSLQSIQQQTSGGKAVVVLALYMLSLLVFIALNQMVYSDKFKAAWMFYVTPVAAPGVLIIGAVKSILVKFYLPCIIVMATAGCIVIGFGFLPNLLLAVFNVIFISSLTTYLNFNALPFSKPQNVVVQSGSFIRNFSRSLALVLLGVLHYALYAITPAIIILAVLSAIAGWYVLDSIKKTSWSKLALADDL